MFLECDSVTNAATSVAVVVASAAADVALRGRQHIAGRRQQTVRP